MAFLWGLAAGATAVAAARLGPLDFGTAIAIAFAPIIAGTFVSLHRRLRRSHALAWSLKHDQDVLHAHCIVSMTDEQHNLVYVNDKLLELTGFERGELIGRSARSLYPSNDANLFQDIRTRLERNEKWEGETRVCCKDGSFLWSQATIIPKHDFRGRFCGTISVRTDITNVKKAASQRELFQALHKIADEVYVFEPETYRFTYMNERAMARFGWDADTYTTKTLADAEPQFDGERFGRLVAPLLDGSADRIERQVSFGGTPHDVFIQLIRPEVGPLRFAAIFRDVSERIEVEQIKEEFIATVSHELRSPLTSIKGALGLILSGAIDEIPEKSRSLLEIAHRNADRLVLIVNDILDLEKIAAGKMTFDRKPGDLKTLVTDAIEANSAGAARFDVSVEFDDRGIAARAEFDHDRMMQVLTNLLSNAMKFSHPGGKVVVSLGEEDGRYAISIRDHGVGIPAEALATIFDRFVQAPNRSERSGKGTGLGLSIVKAIIEQHGGTVSIDSQLDVGTTVRVLLPKPETLSNPVHGIRSA